MTRFADELRRLREAANMSQDKLAERIGVRQQSVSKWENDKTHPSLQALARLERLYGLPLGALYKVAVTDP